jgi:IS5 family transposase
MKQQTLAMAADQTAGFEQHRKPTRRDEFLASMNQLVPWDGLCAVIEPYYPKRGNGRPPIGLERMLRIHFIQHWFNLADLACAEALYDSASLRRFAGIDLGREPVPAATTLLKFRHLLEKHKLAEQLFAEVGRVLQGAGMTVKTGTIGDATIIGAPSSTRNSEKKRDPEMHQTTKGQQWYFGMKLPLGVDSQSGLAHSKAPKARDFTNRRTRKAGGDVDEVERGKNRNQSAIRARVEHVFAVVKRLWGFTKVRYRGLAKNASRTFTALALANISLARRHLAGQVRP